MNKATKAIKGFFKQIWDAFVWSLTTSLGYVFASSFLMMMTMQGDLVWSPDKLLPVILCFVAPIAYNVIVYYAVGGTAYEMLASGNVKRNVTGVAQEYKIGKYKYTREYRPWKGFVHGAWMGIFLLITALVFGINQQAIDTGNTDAGLATFVMFGLSFAGWAIAPFYFLNQSGMGISYFYALLLMLVPILVSGIVYIIGAYARRNKYIRERILAERQAKKEEERQKKINYGGLPGTKPNKRK